MRPTPIVREDKVLGQESPKPLNQKYTYQNANEDRDKINAAINYLPIFITSDENGIIKDNILSGIQIGAIFQVGSPVSYSEYDQSFGTADWDEFSKDIDETTIMKARTHTPINFSPNSKFILFPR